MNTRLLALAVLSGVSSQALAAPVGGYFGRPDVNSGWRLNKTVVEGSEIFVEGERIHSNYTVTYKFDCTPGGFRSNIEVFAGADEKGERLVYSARSGPAPSVTFNIEGVGPIQLVDLNPGDTAIQNFKPTCDLSIDYVGAPSSKQIDIWLASIPALVASIDLKVAIGSLTSDIKMWYVAYVASPDGAAGFLKNEIDKLRLPGSSEADLARALAYEEIINGNSLANVLAPLVYNLDDLRKVYDEAIVLKRKLVNAESGQKEILESALSRASTLLDQGAPL